MRDHLELFGVPLRREPRPPGPRRERGFDARATLRALEREGERGMRRVALGCAVLALGAATWTGHGRSRVLGPDALRDAAARTAAPEAAMVEMPL